jgi:inosine-uridine nucleoside N-ribohydrolase
VTNLAKALMKQPNIYERISKLRIMGGYPVIANMCGKPWPLSRDYNFQMDPDAGLHVLSYAHKINISLIGAGLKDFFF